MPRSKTTHSRLRTRKEILQAAARLLKSGRALTIDEIAKEALVSRATAYRYFSDVDELLLEVAIDESVPDPKEIFDEMTPSDVIERIHRAEEVMHDYCYKNEGQIRLMLSRNLARPKKNESTKKTPTRQNRRAEYIHEALAPHRSEFDEKTLKKLSEALALALGPEAMIVFRDVIPLEAKRAREVKRWVIESLVKTALSESARRKR